MTNPLTQTIKDTSELFDQKFTVPARIMGRVLRTLSGEKDHRMLVSFPKTNQTHPTQSVVKAVQKLKEENDNEDTSFAFRKQGSAGLTGYDFAVQDFLALLEQSITKPV